MKAVVQRVRRAAVEVAGDTVGEIGPGLCVLLGVSQTDTHAHANRLAARVARLRIFENDAGRFDRSVLDTGGAVLVVSQFTLLGDTARGNRPSFSEAAPRDQAEPLYDAFGRALAGEGIRVETGSFGAHMVLTVEHDGPVTVMLAT